MSYEKIAIIASETEEASEAKRLLSDEYGCVAPEQADAVIALGGDGLMLQTLHRFMHTDIPIYGMNCGSVGFLMNEYDPDNLPERLNSADLTVIHPLRMHAVDGQGGEHEALAINEVSMLRETYQAARLRIFIDGKLRMEQLICDGVLVATPAGSTAYNLSAHGPILPIKAPLLALTPISAFRPRRWRGALLPDEAQIRIEVLDAKKRPVSAVADHNEIRNVSQVDIAQDSDIEINILFDQGHSLDERVIREQFLY